MFVKWLECLHRPLGDGRENNIQTSLVPSEYGADYYADYGADYTDIKEQSVGFEAEGKKNPGDFFSTLLDHKQMYNHPPHNMLCYSTLSSV